MGRVEGECTIRMTKRQDCHQCHQGSDALIFLLMYRKFTSQFNNNRSRFCPVRINCAPDKPLNILLHDPLVVGPRTRRHPRRMACDDQI